MALSEELIELSNARCELCQSDQNLNPYTVTPENQAIGRSEIVLCSQCDELQKNPDTEESALQHWRCLNDAIWSPVPAVKVLAWRITQANRAIDWLREIGDMMYLEEDEMVWARAGLSDEDEESIVHKDSNGQTLEAGDTVILIKDLKVKGANFTAKRGTAVRRISLVRDNPDQIEGRVEGQHIVILTQYVKKSKA